MRTFQLRRDVDVTGVSGTGVIADGAEFENGKVALCWRGERSSVSVWDSLAVMQDVHGHDGATRVIWNE